MNIKQSIKDSILLKENILNNTDLLHSIEKAANEIISSLKNGGKILFCGNGGSAADAQHLASELSGRFYYDRDPLPAEALHVNTSFITAVANDYGFNEIYSRLVKANGKKGDVIIGLSTSGNSENVIKAFQTATSCGMITIALTGSTGGKIKDVVSCLINVPSDDTPRIQEAHIMIGHIICEIVESAMFPLK
ncbi:MAG: D-sedoheptulose 7-phosphate isomerase [Bacteroidetes bacterium]|nr:D-sedoheptulose 7-phosphate isomerase [Bacteroidota bacterium]